MYFAVVILLLLVFPVASVITEAVFSPNAVNVILLIGKWFVFWGVGVRLFIAGLRQVIQPEFTSLARSDWVVPAAIVGGLYYGLAGAGHIPQKNKNAKEYTAMVSDGFVFLVLAVFVLKSLT